MTDIIKLNENLPNSNKISSLNEFILQNEGGIERAAFDKNEIQEIYDNLCLDREFLRDQAIGNSLITYSGWSSLLSETGYDIWKYTPTNYAFSSLNNLYFDSKVLTNEGEASSESATTYDKVYVYDDDSGGGFEDRTTEAGTPSGTEFTLMEDDGDYLYVGLDTTYAGILLQFKTRGSNYTNTMSYYNASSGTGWQSLSADTDSLVDNTSNFESDGNITFDIPDDWATVAVNGETKYWIRIDTSTVPVTNAEAYYIIPANNVPGLLAMSSSEVQDEAWKWCSYSGSIYVTIRNAGNTAYEGDYYITSASSATNLQNFFIYNHQFLSDYCDSTYDPVVTKTSDYTATGDEGMILIDTTSENVIITLPSAVGIEGKKFIIKCIVLDSGRTASIDLESGQTIDGLSSYNFSNENDSVILVSDGANYKRISYINLGAGSGDMTKCFHPDTRTLTKSGWKNIAEVTKEDSILTLNQDTKELEYQKPNRLFKYDYSGKLLGRKTSQLNYLVTPNHKFLVNKWLAGGNPYRIWGEDTWENAEEISIKRRAFPLVGKWNTGEKIDSFFNISGNLYIKFLAWFLSEGCVCGTGIYVTQQKHKKEVFDIWDKVAKILDRSFFVNKLDNRGCFKHAEFSKYLSQFGKSHEKFIPDNIKNATKEEIILFLDTYKKGDGSTKGFILYTVSKRMADDLLELVLKAGYWASVTNGGIHGFGVRDLYRVNVNKHNLVGSTTPKDNRSIDYSGNVYCVEVDNHLLYTELNGKCLFAGNSVYDTDDDGRVDKAESVDDGTNVSSAVDIKDAVTKKHTRAHAIDGSSDHTSTITQNNLMDADANGLPDDSGLTVANTSDAISKKHSQNTDTNTNSDTWKIGDGTDTTKTINAQNGDGNEPGLRYSSGDNEWQFSNDGTTWGAIGAGGAPWRIIDIGAGAWDYPVTNPAPLEIDVGTNHSILTHLFDDTTPEFIQRVIEMPHDLDASGSIYIYVYGYAKTADGNEIQLRLSYHGSALGESWDAAYSTLDSGDYVTDAQQDELDYISLNETVSNMGLAADDLTPVAISRTAIDDGSGVSGDYRICHVRFKIARS